MLRSSRSCQRRRRPPTSAAAASGAAANGPGHSPDIPHSGQLDTPHHAGAMSAAIFELLEALPAHFAGVAPSAAAAEQALDAAGELAESVSPFAKEDFAGDNSHLERWAGGIIACRGSPLPGWGCLVSAGAMPSNLPLKAPSSLYLFCPILGCWLRGRRAWVICRRRLHAPSAAAPRRHG